MQALEGNYSGHGVVGMWWNYLATPGGRARGGKVGSKMEV